MSRCFISYRHVSPDQELGHALSEHLGARGHQVFLDTRIGVGTRWVDEIEREIRASEFFIVLLSAESVRSDMVRQEVALAHGLSSAGKLRILPVRVAYSAALPYDLGAYLNPLQSCFWESGEPFAKACLEIESAIRHLSGGPAEAAAAASPAMARFDSEGLARLSEALAVYVGPMARVLVNQAAKRAQTWKQLCDSVAQEVPAGHERERFLARWPVL